MQIYLEKGFIDEFIHLDLKNEFVIDFYEELIKKSKGYELFTDFEEEDFHNLISINPFARFIVGGLVSVSYCCSINDFLRDKSSVHKILLVNNFEEDKGLDTTYEYISSADVIEKWKIYTPKRDDLNLPTTLDESLLASERFSSWDDLLRFKHPLTDIHIYDNYLLVNGDNQRIKDNLIPLLVSLNKMSKNKKTIKLFCFENQIMPFDERAIDEKFSDIKSWIEDAIGNCDVEVIRLSSKSKSRLHDRYIITNLFMIERGAGFNIFKADGSIDDFSSMLFRFIFLKRNYVLSQLVRKQLEKIEDYN